MNTSQKKVQQIYCDESGFTGNDLLNQETPFFAYAAVAVSHEEAKEFVEKLIKDYKIQSSELKFKNLIKSTRGKQAISHILENFSERAKVSIHDKKYALACKFYEYIVEPTVASHNSVFYKLNFNQFISNFLYYYFQAKKDNAEEIFQDFYRFMKTYDDQGLSCLFNSSGEVLDELNELDLIRTFCIHQRDVINEELESLKGTGVGKWILELTVTSIVSLLTEWGQEFNQLEVFCDDSKPLKEQLEFFDSILNNPEKNFIEINGTQYPLTFNLVNLPQLVSSKTYPGIQIADIFSGAFAFVFRETSKRKDSSYPKEWIPHIDNSWSSYSILPSLEHWNFTKINVQRNYLILKELTERSTRNIPLLEGIDTFIAEITYNLHIFNIMQNQGDP
ncbi:DUF3800 domain-containing protein [Laspinema sp. A4]|uniref:DUF3800 domain-containing protein n=1 Tax=Laspinema sp. D2d TaxID=2953686 RepID=UPI0021BBA8B5|nr:DUF3800 domain-containing protein [Laspinema sp. D2d]MCT7985563.1 DUF3800 domain-containing protein [Laspinema sp. D2d]